MQTRTRWTIVGLVVGAAFLGLAVHQADFAASWDVLRTAHIGWAKAVLACGLLFMVIKALRWSIVLRPLSQCPQGFLLRTVFVGTAANLVVPHSGEVLRATLLARRQSLAPSAVLATIAIERILDFIALVILTAVALLIDPRVSPLLWSAGLISLALATGAFAQARLDGALQAIARNPALQAQVIPASAGSKPNMVPALLRFEGK